MEAFKGVLFSIRIPNFDLGCAGGPVSVLVRGGAHDLSDTVPEGVQYIRVGTTGYERMMGK